MASRLSRYWPWHRRRLRQRNAARTFSLRRRIDELEAKLHGLERVLDSLDEAVIAVDRAGLVVHVNDAAVELLGIDPQRAVGNHMFAAVPSQPVCDALEDVVRSRVPSDMLPLQREAVVEREDAESLQITIAVRPLRVRGRGSGEDASEGAIAVVQDVTELRRLERARADFFANVSHELKTPVTAIRGIVETLLDDPAMDPPVRDRFLRKAVGQSDRLSTLVGDILALSRLESDPGALERVPVDVMHVVSEVLAAAVDTAASRSVRLEHQHSGSPATVIGDEEALRQAVANLVDNAVVHSPAGSTVQVAVVGGVDDVTLDVVDTGVGIPEADLERVFERFYRVDAARSRERGGTGIGLSIVKHVALAHGGQVTVSSELGLGSTFSLRLPAGGS